MISQLTLCLVKTEPGIEMIRLMIAPSWQSSSTGNPAGFPCFPRVWFDFWNEIWDVKTPEGVRRGARERPRPSLSQLGFWQSVIPAVKRGDLAAYDLLTVLQTFPHSVRFDMFSILDSSAEPLKPPSQTCLCLQLFRKFFAERRKKKTKNFLLFQCFIFKSTLFCGLFVQSNIRVQGIAPCPSGNCCLSKNKWGVVWTSAEKSEDTKYYRTFTFGGSFFSIIFWAWIFLSFFFPTLVSIIEHNVKWWNTGRNLLLNKIISVKNNRPIFPQCAFFIFLFFLIKALFSTLVIRYTQRVQ